MLPIGFVLPVQVVIETPKAALHETRMSFDADLDGQDEANREHYFRIRTFYRNLLVPLERQAERLRRAAIDQLADATRVEQVCDAIRHFADAVEGIRLWWERLDSETDGNIEEDEGLNRLLVASADSYFELQRTLLADVLELCREAIRLAPFDFENPPAPPVRGATPAESAKVAA